jgi:hypothetical protein
METNPEPVVDILSEESQIVFDLKLTELPVTNDNSRSKINDDTVVEPTTEKNVSKVSTEFINKIKILFCRVLTDEHLKMFENFIERNDAGLLLDLSSYSVFLDQSKQKEFTLLIDNLRKHFSVVVMNEKECRNRLVQLKGKVTSKSDNDIINNAIQLLDYPEQSEVTSNADYELFNLSNKMTDRRGIIEIQELFLFLNSLFETAPSQKNNKRK